MILNTDDVHAYDCYKPSATERCRRHGFIIALTMKDESWLKTINFADKVAD